MDTTRRARYNAPAILALFSVTVAVASMVAGVSWLTTVL
jgi:hypothetical protein